MSTTAYNTTRTRQLDSNFYSLAPGQLCRNEFETAVFRIANQSPVGVCGSLTRNNFAPRIGFAWDVFGDGKTSLRGGYGLAYERNFGNVTFNVIQNPPNYAVLSLFNNVGRNGSANHFKQRGTFGR